MAAAGKDSTLGETADEMYDGPSARPRLTMDPSALFTQAPMDPSVWNPSVLFGSGSSFGEHQRSDTPGVGRSQVVIPVEAFTSAMQQVLAQNHQHTLELFQATHEHNKELLRVAIDQVSESTTKVLTAIKEQLAPRPVQRGPRGGSGGNSPKALPDPDAPPSAADILVGSSAVVPRRSRSRSSSGKRGSPAIAASVETFGRIAAGSALGLFSVRSNTALVVHELYNSLDATKVNANCFREYAQHLYGLTLSSDVETDDYCQFMVFRPAIAVLGTERGIESSNVVPVSVSVDGVCTMVPAAEDSATFWQSLKSTKLANFVAETPASMAQIMNLAKFFLSPNRAEAYAKSTGYKSDKSRYQVLAPGAPELINVVALAVFSSLTTQSASSNPLLDITTYLSDQSATHFDEEIFRVKETNNFPYSTLGRLPSFTEFDTSKSYFSVADTLPGLKVSKGAFHGKSLSGYLSNVGALSVPLHMTQSATYYGLTMLESGPILIWTNILSKALDESDSFHRACEKNKQLTSVIQKCAEKWVSYISSVRQTFESLASKLGEGELLAPEHIDAAEDNVFVPITTGLLPSSVAQELTARDAFLTQVLNLKLDMSDQADSDTQSDSEKYVQEYWDCFGSDDTNDPELVKFSVRRDEQPKKKTVTVAQIGLWMRFLYFAYSDEVETFLDLAKGFGEMPSAEPSRKRKRSDDDSSSDETPSRAAVAKKQPRLSGSPQ